MAELVDASSSDGDVLTCEFESHWPHHIKGYSNSHDFIKILAFDLLFLKEIRIFALASFLYTFLEISF